MESWQSALLIISIGLVILPLAGATWTCRRSRHGNGPGRGVHVRLHACAPARHAHNRMPSQAHCADLQPQNKSLRQGQSLAVSMLHLSRQSESKGTTHVGFYPVCACSSYMAGAHCSGGGTGTCLGPRHSGCWAIFPVRMTALGAIVKILWQIVSDPLHEVAFVWWYGTMCLWATHILERWPLGADLMCRNDAFGPIRGIAEVDRAVRPRFQDLPGKRCHAERLGMPGKLAEATPATYAPIRT